MNKFKFGVNKDKDLFNSLENNKPEINEIKKKPSFEDLLKNKKIDSQIKENNIEQIGNNLDFLGKRKKSIKNIKEENNIESLLKKKRFENKIEEIPTNNEQLLSQQKINPEKRMENQNLFQKKFPKDVIDIENNSFEKNNNNNFFNKKENSDNGGGFQKFQENNNGQNSFINNSPIKAPKNEHSGKAMILIAILGFILFKDIWQLILNLYNSITGVVGNRLNYEDVVYIVKIGFGLLLSLLFFFPKVLGKSFASPMGVFGNMTIEGIYKVKEAGDKQNPEEERKVGIIVIAMSLISLILTIIVIHYIYINTFLTDSKTISETIGSIGLVGIIIAYTGYLSMRIQTINNKKNINSSEKINSLMINILFYVLGMVAALQIGTIITETLTQQVEQKTNEVIDIFQ